VKGTIRYLVSGDGRRIEEACQVYPVCPMFLDMHEGDKMLLVPGVVTGTAAEP